MKVGPVPLSFPANNDTNWQYRVTVLPDYSTSPGAFNSATVSLLTNPKSVLAELAPNGPESLAHRVSWIDDYSFETGFIIERRRTDSATSAVLGIDTLTAGTNATELIDSDIVAGISYHYRVQAISSDGASEFSDWMAPQ